MAQVLYVDYRYSTKEISDRLRHNGIEADCIDNQIRNDKAVLDIFWDEYASRLAEYRVLIAHLGVSFNV